MLASLRKRLRAWACPDCDQDCDRLARAEQLHVLSVDAVRAAQKKQAKRTSDVRVVVNAALRAMEHREDDRC